ncbi:hypothetical protein OAG68_02830 [bacterium]|nr:hypothetical protein [bacterium]
MGKHKTIVRSTVLPALEMRNLLNGLCDLDADVSIAENYLVAAGQILDPEYHYRATFSTLQPVSFDNFDSVPECLVMFDRTGALCESNKIASEVLTVIEETGKWWLGGYSTLRDYVISDLANGITILLTAKSNSDVWRLRWRGINASRFRSANTPEKRLQMVNSFLKWIATNMRIESCNAVLSGDYVVGPEIPHGRILINDSVAVLGEQLENYEIHIEFLNGELEAMINSISDFCNEFGIRVRVSDGHAIPLDRYQQWLEKFSFRSACYDYIYNGHVLPHAIDFFAYETDQVPEGFVPIANIRVRNNNRQLGFVDISCDFSGSSCIATLSGENVDGITRLCELGGISNTEIVYS